MDSVNPISLVQIYTNTNFLATTYGGATAKKRGGAECIQSAGARPFGKSPSEI